MQNLPFTIIRDLFPTLVSSARYARLLQKRIEAVEEKEGAANIFAAALSDADLTIQTAVEVEMLARFPMVPFFGEEWKSSRNTKYLVGNYFVDGCDFLVTLDPIDGTRHYIDGHPLYQIILTVVSRDGFEGVMVLFPEYGDYVYALKGKGAFRGIIEASLEEAIPWKVASPPTSRMFLDEPFLGAYGELVPRFDEVYRLQDYSRTRQLYHVGAALRHELSGAVLGQAQVIDGAALAFVAKEMGYLVEQLDPSLSTRPGDHPSLVLPGFMVAENADMLRQLRKSLVAVSR